jgi:8-oxo-dGTP pyrophosphatase MutT (NUDIX family)
VFPADSIPAHFRKAAVLILFWEGAGDARVLLTRRSREMSRHAGQVSFPGGLLEAGETWEEGALREAEEEVGIEPARVEVVGRLDDAWSGSGNHLVPVVGWLDTPPSLTANPGEVDEILTPRVSELLRPEAVSAEEVLVRGVRYSNAIVEWAGARAYGLSADLLLEALGWATGGDRRRGPARLAELESYFGPPGSASTSSGV